MYLNLGCGMHKPDGWHNVDIWAACAPDMVADAVTLGLPAGSVGRIYLGHLLEHIDYGKVDDLVYNVWRMLEPGGYVCAVTIDADRVDRMADPLLWELVNKGTDEERSDRHGQRRWSCTGRELVNVMSNWFGNTQPIDLGRVRPAFPLVSDVHWQCAVMARKPMW